MKTKTANLLELQEQARELADNAVILYPEATVGVLAQQLATEEPELSSEIGKQLMVGYWSQLVRKAKAAHRKPAQQLPLPGFEHLPATIPRVSGKSRTPLVKATYTELRNYHRLLFRRWKEGQKRSARLVELERLMELLKKAPDRTKAIRVGEIMAAAAHDA